MAIVLLTGFEPFNDEPINPSLEAVKALHGEIIKGYEIVSKALPVTFIEAKVILAKIMEEAKPDVVISVGQAGGRSSISLERVAINIDDSRIPDNNGYQPIDQPINENGPVAYWSKLPIKAIVKNLKEAGIPVEVSQTAGTYVCNHVFYSLMDLLSQKESIRGGFIHIPFIPEQAVRHPGQPSLGLDSVIKALRIAIKTTITYDTDIAENGGKVS